jgi:hypothetical protein
MKFMKRIVPIIFIGFLVSSCVTTKVKVNTAYTNGVSVDTLNLISTMIGPVMQPVLPLVDAAAFNEKTNKIADEILDDEQKRVEEFKEVLTKTINYYIITPVLTGSYFSSDAANKYKVKNGVQIDNKNFPIVIFSTGDLNVVDFGKGKNVTAIFKDNQGLKSQIKNLATELNLSTVLISYNRLNVVSAGMFGVNGSLRLETYLFLYNASGNLLVDAYGWSKPTVIKGKELSEYQLQLDNFQELSNLMLKEFLKYIK